jgi:hypothetical protein
MDCSESLLKSLIKHQRVCDKTSQVVFTIYRHIELTHATTRWYNNFDIILLHCLSLLPQNASFKVMLLL